MCGTAGASWACVRGEDEITADVTILADGVNSLLSEKAKLAKRPAPHQLAVSAKEVVELPEQTVTDRFQANHGEGAAWLFAGAATHGHVGGGFLYTNRSSVVHRAGGHAVLTSARRQTPVYQMLEDFKNHPAVAPVLAGGRTVGVLGASHPRGRLRHGAADVLRRLPAHGRCRHALHQPGLPGARHGLRRGGGQDGGGRRPSRRWMRATSRLRGSRRTVAKLEDSFVLKDLAAYRGFPAFMEGTPRIFDGYPHMAGRTSCAAMFTVDGSPVRPLKGTVMGPVKGMGVLNLLKDARKGMKVL